MIHKTNTLFILVIAIAPCTAYGMLLTAPKKITQEEVATLKNIYSSMCWSHPHGTLEFYYMHGKTRFNLYLNPNTQLPHAHKHKFSETIDQQGNKKLIFRYKYIPPQDKDNTAAQECIPLDVPLTSIEDPLTANNIDTIAHLIKDKKVLFYTGAGISAGSVPTMQELMDTLELTQLQQKENQGFFTRVKNHFWPTDPYYDLVNSIMKDPKAYNARMKKFFHACLYAKPTPAHYTIAQLVQENNWGLLTENLDFLHEDTGILPLKRSTARWLHDNVTPEHAQHIDYVIAVGLATDESGFLNWYKKHNKKGVIIALNLVRPNYVGKDDIFLAGDAQERLLALQEQLQN